MLPSAASERRPIKTVSELTHDLKLQLEGNFANVWVSGEISNLKQPASGHTYFVLKDERAQLPAVMFRGTRRFLRFRPTDGMAVLVRGRITVYEPRGAYQMQVEGMEPRGQGALQLAFEQLKERLANEGLFRVERKRPIPKLLQRVGVVTSPSGAALRDFCRVLERRFPNVEVLVYPAQVQGTVAAFELAKGIHVLNRMSRLDAIVLTRGGGSLEDLWPFNEESVARAIFTSRLPVVSAIGHEVDVTIADYVADLRAPTPSAAAEMMFPQKAELVHHLQTLRRRLDTILDRAATSKRDRVRSLTSHYAFAAAKHAVEMRSQRIDELGYRMDATINQTHDRLRRRLLSLETRLEQLSVRRRLDETKRRLERSRSKLNAAISRRQQTAERTFVAASAKLEALSPLGVLGRGYGLAWNARDELLRDVAEVRTGEAIRVTLRRGELHCTVDRVSRNSMEHLEEQRPEDPGLGDES